MLKILHFADAHIDIASQGRHDPQSGLPFRVLDFLKALDTITDTAVNEKPDLVIFAGDAYKDRNPSPTYQREWGKRIIRLSQAQIPTLLLVGNHDLSPAIGRANTLHEFDTLQVPFVKVLSKPCMLGPADLWDLPLQVLALPWISRSGLLATRESANETATEIDEEIETRLDELVKGWLDSVDPKLPVILTAHASVQGATYGNERSVMLGNDLVLPGALVKDKRLDYVALGHIHKKQNLNEGGHPPVVYPGSIERVDFGEAQDEKFFAMVELEKGKTRVDFRKLDGRRFYDSQVRFSGDEALPSPEDLNQRLMASLPPAADIKDAIVRLVIEYPRDWETLIDETSLRQAAEQAFEFHLIRRPQVQSRIRLPGGQSWSSIPPQDLLVKYLESQKEKSKDVEILKQLAEEVIKRASEDEIEV
jgi:exonuclease SbcD